MADTSALWREDATEDEQTACYQALIDSGDAWKLEGHVGRTAMALIESGQCCGCKPDRVATDIRPLSAIVCEPCYIQFSR
jgi:hypothetical protein